jgi:hypothetical protein
MQSTDFPSQDIIFPRPSCIIAEQEAAAELSSLIQAAEQCASALVSSVTTTTAGNVVGIDATKSHIAQLEAVIFKLQSAVAILRGSLGLNSNAEHPTEPNFDDAAALETTIASELNVATTSSPPTQSASDSSVVTVVYKPVLSTLPTKITTTTTPSPKSNSAAVRARARKLSPLAAIFIPGSMVHVTAATFPLVARRAEKEELEQL